MDRNVFRWDSLKTKISLATLGIFLLSLWSLWFYASRVLLDDMQRLLGEQQLATVSMVAAQINSDLEQRLEALEKATEPVARLMEKGHESVQWFMTQRVAFRSMFNNGVYAIGASGNVIADTDLEDGRLGTQPLDDDLMARLLQQGKATIGRPAGEDRDRGSIFVMAVPVRDVAGRIVGALVGETDLGLPNFLERVTNSRYGKTGGYLILAPEDRSVVAATDKYKVAEHLPERGKLPLLDRFLDGNEGSGVGVSPRGIEVLVSAKRIAASGWYALAALPTEEAFAPIRDVGRRMLIATILATLASTALTWWLTRRQLAPLLVAAKTLVTMAKTDKRPQHLSIVRNDEIGQVIGGFNQLLDTLDQREALLKQVFDTSSVAIFVIDMNGRIAQANQRMAEMFGLPLDRLVGSEYASLVHPSEREMGRRKMAALLNSDVTSVDLDRHYWRGDKTDFWGRLTAKRFHDPSGHELGLVGVIADITVRREATQALLKSKQQYDNLAAKIPVGIYILRSTAEAPFQIVYASPRMAEILGLSEETLLGDSKAILRLIHPDDFGSFIEAERDAARSRRALDWNGRVVVDGELKWLHITSFPETQDNGDILWHGLVTDITERKEHQKQLEHIAHYDVLTTLPNRVLLADRLHQAMTQEQRRGSRLAVVYLDLDGFKAINDRHGHETGDQLLIALAARMKRTLREGDTLARLGGDEFVAVLLDLDDALVSAPTLTRLLDAAAQPVLLGNSLLQVSASLGVTFYPQTDDVDADQLLRQADHAMYQAKLAGKNRYHVFDADQDRHLRGHHESVERIRHALAAREFVLYYQPKVNLRRGTVVGAEALIRWQHPQKGLLAPGVFLPAIENHALAVDIGEWVIDTALTQMEVWRAQGLNIPVGVNISARHLQEPDFVDRLQGLLAAHPGVRASDLSLEVLETSALEDVDRASRVIEACREIGVMFALDDFGTGYSSLTYLKRLPVTQLKIDQSFVRDMLDDPDDLTILEGVISLADAFRRQVIAEGVETVEHGELLLQLGCDLAQGYGIARPMAAADFPAWSATWRPDMAWRNLEPIHEDDLPLLFASVEHRAWVVALVNHLRGDGAPPPLDHHQCRFGIWADGDGRLRYGDAPAFQVVQRMHRHAHVLALELCDLRRAGHDKEALARVDEIYNLRDTLISNVNMLMRGRRSLAVVGDAHVPAHRRA
ncbi:EAL domain-containing protein [Propionivibrio soli]|uniref:EAL domain-containing protein n=1 Tax=Propionivibrio soli TaxID=2976531 RepID=UPI0021E780C2|nr:EAL domain-containing protein [Propionivibrio soli]